jgi:hypothetical protein
VPHLGRAWLVYIDDYATLIVSFFDILVSFGNLFQWIAPIYGWSDLIRLKKSDKFVEEIPGR